MKDKNVRIVEVNNNPLHPSPELLIKLGSLIVHYQEYISVDGNIVDLNAIDTILYTDDVQEWFDAMNKLAFLPVKRNLEF